MGTFVQAEATPSPVQACRLQGQLGDAGRRQLLGCVTALGGLGAVGLARAGGPSHEHDHSAHGAHLVGRAPSAQAAASSAPAFRRREARYQVPAVTMVDQAGRAAAFDSALGDGRPVILNFIFTSCTTICPVMTQIFVQVQSKLAGELGKVHMVSVSIDPEYDTPSRLLAYTRQYGAGPQWDFYTGSADASTRVQKAFDAYRGGKMNHEAVVLLRGRRGAPWVRLDGFADAAAIVDAYRSVVA